MNSEYADSLINHLNTVGAVPVGGRLTISRGQLSAQRLTRTQWVSRMWHGDSRQSTIQRVRDVVAGAVSVADTMMSCPRSLLLSDIGTLGGLVVAMEASEVGLRNLRGTYAGDDSSQLALLGVSERLRSRSLVVRAFLHERATRQAAMIQHMVREKRDRSAPSVPEDDPSLGDEPL
jgi:hypothetical protein